ncbi:MAG: LCP family protein [Cellulosilyticum sp.]|nr:LCP family protein [Cellulosilyticum sp.]
MEKEIIKETEQEVEEKSKNHSNQLFRRAAFITLGVVGVIFMVALIVGRNLVKAVQVDTEYIAYTPKASHHNSDMVKKEGKKPKVKSKTIMVFGVDKGEGRTDTILIAHLDSNTEKVSVVSVPRDTRVYWSEEQRDKAKELDRIYQYESKITDMSSLGGIENLRHFTIRSVEELLDVRVDNYVVVNTEVIRELVDALGGIEVDVPRRMEYDDNYQDLHIDLQPGLQVLNGEQAEGLLRWRHNKDYSEQYAMGDLGRIETQQLFISAFADKIINDLPVTKLLEVATAVYRNIQTDIKMSELMDYVKYIPYLKMENIKFDTLPGDSANIGGFWYYLVDEETLPAFVDEHFYGGVSVTSDPLFSVTKTYETTTTRAAISMD